MDGGYRGEDFMRWVIDMFTANVEIVLRPTGIEGFCPLAKTLGCRENFWMAQLVSALEPRIMKGYQKRTRLLSTSP